VGKRRIHHRVVFTVTNLTKVIDGVRNLVLWDRDYSANRLVEAALAFFAQDNDGHVWHWGQYPRSTSGASSSAPQPDPWPGRCDSRDLDEG